MFPKNQEKGSPGEPITLNAIFRVSEGGDLINPDSTPLYTIKDPDSIIIEQGTATQTSLGNFEVIFDIPENAQISNLWSIEWAVVLNGIKVENKEFFNVISSALVGGGNVVKVPDEWLVQVKKVLAFPSTSKIILSDTQIKELAFFPAMHDYFVKFPLKITDSFQMGADATQTFNFPDAETYAIIDARFTGKLEQSSGGSSFWELINYTRNYGQTTNIRGGYGRGRGSYGSPYNFNGQWQAIIAQRQVADSIANRITTKVHILKSERKVEAYSSSSSRFNITWAKRSNCFEDIEYERQFDVVKLAQANLLLHLSDTTGIITDSAAEATVNSDALKTRAEDLRNEVYEKWEQFPDVILMRF